MGSQGRADMYCEECHRTVVAQRGAHRTRSTLGAFLTGDCGMEVEPWRCPHCGGPVEARSAGSGDRLAETRPEGRH